jgi:Tfp pilus assembly ATPase PilU
MLACEILTNNERAQEWIIGGHDATELIEVMKEGAFHGMQTIDQALMEYVIGGEVSLESILPHVRYSHEVKAKALQAGMSI